MRNLAIIFHTLTYLIDVPVSNHSPIPTSPPSLQIPYHMTPHWTPSQVEAHFTPLRFWHPMWMSSSPHLGWHLESGQPHKVCSLDPTWADTLCPSPPHPHPAGANASYQAISPSTETLFSPCPGSCPKISTGSPHSPPQLEAQPPTILCPPKAFTAKSMRKKRIATDFGFYLEQRSWLWC